MPRVYWKRMRKALLLLWSAVVVCPLAGLEFSDIYAAIGGDRARNAGLTVFPTLLIPAGGEFEGMGQAYAAVARDVSFFDANPAASATLEFTELTLIHNNWIADTALDGVLYTRRFGDLGMAVGGKFLHVPFTRYDAFSRQVSGGRYSEGTVGLNASYNFLRSYAFSGLSVGATLKTAYRYVPPQIAIGQSAAAVLGDVGVLSRFNLLKRYASRSPNFAVAAVARNFGPPVRGEPLPSQLVAGLAWSPIRPLVIATDLLVPVFLARDVPAERIGGAIGTSVRVTPFFSAQSGLLLRWGGSRFALGATLDLTDISVNVNYNLDLATQWNSFDRFSIQARLNFGDDGRRARRDLVDQYYLEAWTAYSIGDVDRAMERSLDALGIDPTFSPAAELYKISRLDRDLQDALRELDLERIGGAGDGSR